jgi:multiple sugar transport system substrate-binding protein
MARLEFSAIAYDESLPALLQARFPTCTVHRMTWERDWQELMRIALYRSGPDVSQVAAPAVDDFVTMGALRPFRKEEIDAIGGAAAFLPSAWRTVHLPGGKQIWAVPWLADVRIIYYWRDMLADAGIDEDKAFQTPEQVENTMSRLQASGIRTPWAVGVNQSFMTLQTAASWVWGSGGDLFSDEGRHILFDQPRACEGFRAYFELCRYMPEDIRRLDIANLFIERQVAAMIGAIGWLTMMRNLPSYKDIGLALPPGPAYVGGSNLVIWQHSDRQQEAVELVNFLTSKQMQLDYCQRASYLPVRLDALNEPPFSTDPRLQVLTKAVKTGRAYPTFPKFGLIESRLSDAFINLWNSILDDPTRDLDDLIAPYIQALGRRLAVTLGARY